MLVVPATAKKLEESMDEVILGRAPGIPGPKPSRVSGHTKMHTISGNEYGTLNRCRRNT